MTVADLVNKLTQLEQTLVQPSPLELFTPNWPGASDVTIYIKRDDKIHPVISGNKWRKLKHFIREFVDQSGLSRAEGSLPAEGSASAEGSLPTEDSVRLISFGGGFSNHLHALGYVCYQLAIPLTVVIRGNYSSSPTPMINDLIAWNANIEYVDKATYKLRDTSEYLDTLKRRYPNATIVPEGGSQLQALAGVSDLVTEIDNEIGTNYHTIITPVASGATMAGIVSAVEKHQHVVGIGVLKGQDYLESLVAKFLSKNNHNWHIEHEYHCGGYAKAPAYLTEFCHQFKSATGIAIEPVYSGKVFFALKKMLGQGAFVKGSTLVVVHTGGLQGSRS
ncbi:MAG: cysteine desulfhydrase [Alteromonas sp.]|nr:cysteine desulfhydrase [Alteromonas sp. MB-3u-76]MAI65574.1 cysteine desulfhydrase [Alteromonas sp.]